MTPVKLVNVALHGQQMTLPSLQSPTSEHLPPTHVTMLLICYPNLSKLTIKYIQNESTSFHLCFLCRNPHFYSYWISLLTSFPMLMRNPPQYLLHTTSKNLRTMHCDVAWLFSLRIFDSFPLLFGKKANIQNLWNRPYLLLFLLTSLLISYSQPNSSLQSIDFIGNYPQLSKSCY